MALRPAFDQRIPHELLEQIRSHAAPRLHSVSPAVPRDLVTIVHKAIERDPAHRYPTAAALAADLRHFLADEPILARPMSSVERLARWTRRNRTVAALTAAILLAMLAGTVVSSIFAVAAARQAESEQAAAAAARVAETQARVAEAKALRAKRESDLYAARLAFQQAQRKAEAGSVGQALFGLAEALRLAPDDPEAAAFRRVIRLAFTAWSHQLITLRYAVRLWEPKNSHEYWIHPVGPEGKTFVAWKRGKHLGLWETATGRPLELPWEWPAGDWPLALSPDGELVLSRHGELLIPSPIRLRGLRTGEPAGLVTPVPVLGPRQATPFYQSAVLSTRWVMTGGQLGGSPTWGPRRFWNLETGKAYPLQLSDNGPPSYRLVRTREGKAVAVVSHTVAERRLGADRDAEFWDVETGQMAKLPLRLEGGHDPRIEWDGRALLSINGDESASPKYADGTVFWWDTATGHLRERWQARQKAWFSALSTDSQTLVALGQDERLRLYDLDTGLQCGGDLNLSGTAAFGEVPGATYPGAPIVLTHRGDGVLRAWDTVHLGRQVTGAASPRTRFTPPDKTPLAFRTAAVAPDGRTVLLAADDRLDYRRLVEVATGRLLGPPIGQAYLHHIAYSPDGRLVAVAPHHFWVGGAPTFVHFLDRTSGRSSIAPLRVKTYVHGLAFSPDSRTLAIGCIGAVLLVDAQTGQLRGTIRESSFAASLAFSPDGAVLAVAYRSGWDGVGSGVRLWDVASGKPLGDFQTLVSGTGGPSLQFIDQGRMLVLWDPTDATLFVYDPRTGKPQPVAVPSGRIDGVAGQSGSGTVAVFSLGGTVTQWDLRTGRMVGELMAQGPPVRSLVYSPDGRVLAVICLDNAVRLWDSADQLADRSAALARGRGAVGRLHTRQSRTGDRQRLWRSAPLAVAQAGIQ